MTAPANPIQHSFELAATRCEDLTPLVYDRLFREHPETRAMFRSEGSELVRGSMLALTVDAMLDFAGDRSGHFRMIECEVQSHDAYGTPRELFESMDPELWLQVGENPVRMLVAVGQARLDELAADEDFVARVREEKERLDAYLTGDRWFQRVEGSKPTHIARDTIA